MKTLFTVLFVLICLNVFAAESSRTTTPAPTVSEKPRDRIIERRHRRQERRRPSVKVLTVEEWATAADGKEFIASPPLPPSSVVMLFLNKR